MAAVSQKISSGVHILTSSMGVLHWGQAGAACRSGADSRSCFLKAVGLLAEFAQRMLDAAVGEDAEVADAVKAARQDMAEVSPHEFGDRQCHLAIAGFGLALARGLAVSECDMGAVEAEDTA